MIERINEYAARRFGGVGTTRGSLLRIHAWALVFLVFVSVLAPAHGLHRGANARLDPVAVLRRDPADQRAFAPSPFTKRAFHVAWIFGSEGDVTATAGGNPPNVADFFAKSLPNIGQRRVVVDSYELLGTRLGDIYMTLLDALATKPDLVVVSLNPIWVMNPVAVHRWTQLDARAALEIAKQPKEWPIGAALLSPSDLLWGAAESKLTPIRERFYWSGKVHALVDDLGPLDRSHLRRASSAQRPDRSQVLTNGLPLDFWMSYRFSIVPRSQFGTSNPYNPGPATWAKWVDLSNKGDNQLNALLLRAIGAELRTSGIPSLVYLAQANSNWLATSKPFSRAIGGVEQQLFTFRGAFQARNILYEPQTLSRFVSGVTFVDETHIATAGSLGPYFASQACRVLAQVGRDATCRPVVEGSTP